MTGCRQRLGIKPLFRRNDHAPNYDPFSNDDCALGFLIVALRRPLSINCNKPLFDFSFQVNPSTSPVHSCLSLQTLVLSLSLSSVAPSPSLLGKYLQPSPNKSSLSRGASIWVWNWAGRGIEGVLSRRFNSFDELWWPDRGGPLSQVFVRVIWKTTASQAFWERRGRGEGGRGALSSALCMTFKGWQRTRRATKRFWNFLDF